jgi:hypothetical protein
VLYDESGVLEIERDELGHGRIIFDDHDAGAAHASNARSGFGCGGEGR